MLNFKKELEDNFKKDNLELITEYKGINYPISIRCKDCGRIYEYTMAKTLRDRMKRTDYLCECKKTKITESVQKFINYYEKILSKKYTKIKWFKDYTSLEYITIKCNNCGHKRTFNIRTFRNNPVWECPRCNKAKVRFTKEEIAKAIKNNNNNRISLLKLDENYKNSKDKIYLKCNDCGFIWKIRADRAIEEKVKCPKCYKTYSKGELAISDFLNQNKIKYEKEYSLPNGQRLDFYLLDSKIAIEFDGAQHFEANSFFGGEEAFEKRKKYDKIKNEYCKNNNIELIRISYRDYNNIENILIQRLISSIK